MLISTGEHYLRAYARHPEDWDLDIMPADARWMRATRRLYAKLPPEDKAVIDSYAEDETAPVDRRARRLQLKRLAQLLIFETGIQNKFSMIMLPNRQEGREEEER